MDRLQLQEQRNKHNAFLNSTKKDNIKNKIENAAPSKDLYKICDKLLNRKQKATLPSHDCAQSLANTFVNHFHEKNRIDSKQPWNIIEFINGTSSRQCFHICGVYFEQFSVVSEAYIHKIISSSPTKSYALDPIHTWLLKQCQKPPGTCSYNYCKCLTILCRISNWTEDGLSYPSYQGNNPWLWFVRTTGRCQIFLSFQSLCNALCSISRAFENQQFAWDISVYLQTTSQHRDSTPSCTKWPTPSRWQWGGAI